MWRRWLYVILFASLLIGIIAGAEIFSLASESYPQRQHYSHNQYQPVYATLVQLISGCWRGFRVWFDHDTIATVAIAATAVFTGTLWAATRKLGHFASTQASDMQKLLRAAQDNASAAAGLRAAAEAQAKTAAEQHATFQEQTTATVALSKAAVAVEQPVIFVTEINWLRGGAGNLEARLQYPAIDIIFANFGRTPAFIVQISATICVEKTLPETPNYGAIIRYPPGTLLERGAPITLQSQHRELSVLEIEDIANGNMVIWVYGFVVYSDYIKRSHEMGFCARMFCSQKPEISIEFRFGFAPPEYTYDRERSPI